MFPLPSWWPPSSGAPWGHDSTMPHYSQSLPQWRETYSLSSHSMDAASIACCTFNRVEQDLLVGSLQVWVHLRWHQKKKKKKTAEEICRSLQDRFFLGFYGMPCLISITCGPRASATIMSEYTAYISHPQHKCLWHFIRPTQMASWFADLFTNYS